MVSNLLKEGIEGNIIIRCKNWSLSHHDHMVLRCCPIGDEVKLDPCLAIAITTNIDNSIQIHASEDYYHLRKLRAQEVELSLYILVTGQSQASLPLMPPVQFFVQSYFQDLVQFNVKHTLTSVVVFFIVIPPGLSV